MEKSKPLTFSQYFKIFSSSCGWAAVLTVSYIFSHYYQLFSQVYGFNDSQMGTLMSIVGTVGVFCYLFGGVVADMLRPKVCLNITYISMIILSLICTTSPSYTTMYFVAFGFVVCGILFFSTPMLRFIVTLGSREQQGRIFGLLYCMSGVLSLIIGTIASQIIAVSGAKAGLRWMFILYAAVMAVSCLVHNLIDKSKHGDKIEKTSTFSINMIGDVLKNPNMWLIFVLAVCTYVPSFMGSAYVQPLMKEYFGASTATVALVATYSNFGTMIVMSLLTGALTDKMGSVVNMVLLSLIFLILAATAMLISPWASAYLFVVTIALFMLRSVNAIGKPARNSLVSESRVPAVARGTATGLMFAVMTLPDAFLYKVCGSLLTSYSGSKTGYHIILVSMLVIGAVGIVCALLFRYNTKKAKERDTIEGRPEGLLI